MATSRNAPLLYHWSPTARRAGIVRYGLLPGKPRVTHAGDGDDDWCAPYICLAEDPNWGWALSGGIQSVAGQSWDLWMVYLGDGHPISRIRHWDAGDHQDRVRLMTRPRYHEWRVHDRIYKRGVIYVATRILPCGPSGP